MLDKGYNRGEKNGNASTCNWKGSPSFTWNGSRNCYSVVASDLTLSFMWGVQDAPLFFGWQSL
jgi:hypothetical protein